MQIVANGQSAEAADDLFCSQLFTGKVAFFAAEETPSGEDA
jgi:hypothetical protein